MDDATAVPIRFAPAPGKRTFVSVGGRLRETTALHDPEAQLAMTEAWQQSFGRDTSGNSRQSQKMSSGYADFIRRNRK